MIRLIYARGCLRLQVIRNLSHPQDIIVHHVRILLLPLSLKFRLSSHFRRGHDLNLKY